MSSYSSSSSSATSSGGIGFCGLLTVAFIVLKLLGIITWSWWWVWSPIWIPATLWICIFLGMIAWAVVQDLKK